MKQSGHLEILPQGNSGNSPSPTQVKFFQVNGNDTARNLPRAAARQLLLQYIHRQCWISESVSPYGMEESCKRVTFTRNTRIKGHGPSAENVIYHVLYGHIRGTNKGREKLAKIACGNPLDLGQHSMNGVIAVS